MKKILVIANYFYPDVASLGQLLTDLCLHIRDDFDINVIAAIPNYSKPLNCKEKIEKDSFYWERVYNINVCRIVVPDIDKNNKLSRIRYIMKYFNNCKKSIKFIDDYDIVFATSQPPILGGLLGRYAKRIRPSAKLIYNIQDFNPEQIDAVGYFRNRLLLKLLAQIDNLSLKMSDKIVLVGNDQLQTLKNRSKEFVHKAIIINNWIDEDEIYPLTKNNIEVNEFINKYNLNNKFVVMYSGNIGLFYDLENLVKVANKLRNIKDLVFVFVGEGAKKRELLNYKNDNKLENIIFIEYQSKEKLNISLNSADVHLVVNSMGIKGVSVPSKIYGVLACGKYVVGVLEKGSEARKIIEEAQCGKCVDPQQYDEFEKLIIEAYKRRNELNDIGAKGRKYLEENLRMLQSMNKYTNLFNEILD